ncbi:MAG: transcriptional regulator, partial [Bacteroidales bacterium]|nr:transcriptional regulator [Bacteroidales bacterium]
TYSSKGFVKQNLRELGFDVHRKPGPGQKRHVLQIRL